MPTCLYCLMKQKFKQNVPRFMCFWISITYGNSLQSCYASKHKAHELHGIYSPTFDIVKDIQLGRGKPLQYSQDISSSDTHALY